MYIENTGNMEELFKSFGGFLVVFPQPQKDLPNKINPTLQVPR